MVREREGGLGKREGERRGRGVGRRGERVIEGREGGKGGESGERGEKKGREGREG